MSGLTSVVAGSAGVASYDDLSNTIGLALIVALAVLLAMRDFAPMLRGSSAPRVTRAVDMIAAPLLVAFGVIVLARLGELL